MTAIGCSIAVQFVQISSGMTKSFFVKSIFVLLQYKTVSFNWSVTKQYLYFFAFVPAGLEVTISLNMEIAMEAIDKEFIHSSSPWLSFFRTKKTVIHALVILSYKRTVKSS